MKRSEINNAVRASTAFFEKNGWTLPPSPRWDVTDFGLGNFAASGLLLVNLAEESEYCEKLMYARKGQVTPLHYHKKKKEDIICRTGVLVLQLWANNNGRPDDESQLTVKVNGIKTPVKGGQKITLLSGERITLVPYVWHMFYPASEECIIGEVSTANDDVNDNFFGDPQVGRFSEIEEDETAIVKLLSDKN